MTDPVEQEDEAPTREPDATATRWRHRTSWKFAGEALFAVAALATIGAFVNQVWPLTEGDNPDNPSATSTARETSHPTVTMDAAGSPAVGECLDDSMDPTPRCDIPHSYEVFALDDCSDASLIAYLGGDPTVDIVRAAPQRVDVGGVDACVVSPPAGARNDSPAAGVLQGASDAWRPCIDHRTGQQEVSCAEPHTGEWVSRDPVADEAVDCAELAARYMNAPPSRFSGRLQVGSSRGASGPRCFVTVLGSDLLQGSVRSLGVSSLPTR